MKNKILNLFTLLLLALMVGCNNDKGSVDILSVNTFGNRVCRGDKVRVFVSASVSGPVDMVAKYTWTCTGGELTNPQGLFENLWVAPKEPGVYEITVNIDANGTKKSAKTKITVADEYYYTNFETTYFAEGNSLSSLTLAQQTSGKNVGTVLATSTNNNGRYTRNWNDPAFVAPFSMQMSVNVDKYNATSGNTTNYVAFRYLFNKQADYASVDEYATQLDFKYFVNTGNIQCFLSTYSNSQRTTLTYNISATGTLVATAQTITPASSVLKGKGVKKVAFSMNADKSVSAYCNGVKIIESSLFATDPTVAAKNFVYSIQATQLCLSGGSSSNTITAYLDDYVVLDNGTILTGETIPGR